MQSVLIARPLGHQADAERAWLTLGGLGERALTRGSRIRVARHTPGGRIKDGGRITHGQRDHPFGNTAGPASFPHYNRPERCPRWLQADHDHMRWPGYELTPRHHCVRHGTIRDATAAALPPLDPPVEWLVFHGFRVGAVGFRLRRGGEAEFPEYGLPIV